MRTKKFSLRKTDRKDTSINFFFWYRFQHKYMGWVSKNLISPNRNFKLIKYQALTKLCLSRPDIPIPW